MTTLDVAAFTEFERTGWNHVVDGYHRFLGPVTARAVEPLLDAAGVGPGSNVLDVATGPGYVAGGAAARGAEVVGVDISAEILGLARRLHPGIRFQLADAAELPFGSAEFDAVVAGFLVPHLPDHISALAEFCRVLKPGGTVALSTWGSPERVPLLGLVGAAVAAAGATAPPELPSGPPFFHYSDEETLTGLLRNARLTAVELGTHSFVHRVPSADALWDGVLAGSVRTAALVAGQPVAVRAKIRAAFDELAAAYRADGALELPVSVLVAAGRG